LQHGGANRNKKGVDRSKKKTIIECQQINKLVSC